MRRENPGLDYFLFLLALLFLVAILAAPDDARPIIIVSGVVTTGLWLLRHRADREDARRAHELAMAQDALEVWRARERETP